jgi:hypothetical protein
MLRGRSTAALAESRTDVFVFGPVSMIFFCSVSVGMWIFLCWGVKHTFGSAPRNIGLATIWRPNTKTLRHKWCPKSENPQGSVREGVP